MPHPQRASSDKRPPALLQVVVNAGAVLFLGATLVAAGLYVAASAEAYAGWLPLVMLANTLAASSAAAASNRDGWMCRLLQSLWILGALSLIWFVSAFVAREVYAWPGGWVLAGGHVASTLTVIVVAARRLGDHTSPEVTGKHVYELDQRVTRLEARRRRSRSRRPAPAQRPNTKGQA